MGGRSGQGTGGGGGGGTPALGTGVDSFDDYEDVKIYENGINNTNKSAEYYLSLTGIPKDFDGDAEVVFYQSGKVDVEIRGNGIRMTREISENGKNIYNAFFTIDTDSKYKGKGAEIFANQVKGAQKAGISQIDVSAAGNKNSRYNGYYTWARLGYVPNNQAYNVEQITRATGRNYSTWEKMMSSKQGVKDWKEHGDAWSGTFDLKKGSYSDKSLKRYIKLKSKTN